jgi:hypothetical protein
VVERRWLVIVQRDHRHRLPKIQKLFPGAADVIVDRRDGERRTRDVAVRGNRRSGERRRSLSDTDDRVWTMSGYHVAEVRER